MNLLHLLTREEPIAGLEVSDTNLRLAFLKVNKETSEMEVEFVFEEKLPVKTIVNGALKRKDNFVTTLKNLLKKSSLKIRYVVVSLPSDTIYSKVFSFPGTIQGEKLEETMKLTIGFQLPYNPEGIYLDWEKMPSEEKSDQNKIFLASTQKSVIKTYVDAFNSAGLRPIAIEFHPLSLARVIDIPGSDTVLIKALNKTSAAFFIIKNRALLFSRVLPEPFSSKKTVDAETRKITDFYESENGSITQSIELKDAKIIKTFSSHPEIKKDESAWLISVGAALRGVMPRSKDNLVSLLPVGTEEAYEYQKAAAFAEFVAGVTIGLSVLFSIIFLGAWIAMTSIHQKAINRLEILASFPVPVYATALENRALTLNSLLRAARKTMETAPRWSIPLEELESETVSGISINSLSFPAPEAMMRITGVADSRGQLNLFKETLEGSNFFTNINLPLTNVEQKTNIPFAITFNLKDPSSLYFTQ